jgi:hypothetical protein
VRLRYALVAVGGAWWLGCGSGGSGGGTDGAPDAPLGEDASDRAAEDAPTESASADVSSGDDAAGDATVDVLGADVATGTVVITADATLKSNGGGGGPCAAVDSLAAVPNETTVGRAIQLTASGIDPQGQRADVSLVWTAVGSAGSLAGTTGLSTTFNCTAVGTEMVTVTTSISDGGASCPAIGSLTITLACDAP